MRYYTSILFVTFFLISCDQASDPISYDMLKSKIEKGLDEEQAIRKIYIEKLNSGNFDAALNTKMSEIDSLNAIAVGSFLKSYGYPKISVDGKKLSDGVFYILQHNEVETMKLYIDTLEARAWSGEASKKHFAMMKDRILADSHQKQIYGTQSMPRKNEQGHVTNEYYIWPIAEPLKVDSLRKEVGLTKTIKQMAEEFGFEYNVDEPLPSN